MPHSPEDAGRLVEEFAEAAGERQGRRDRVVDRPLARLAPWLAPAATLIFAALTYAENRGADAEHSKALEGRLATVERVAERINPIAERVAGMQSGIEALLPRLGDLSEQMHRLEVRLDVVREQRPGTVRQ